MTFPSLCKPGLSFPKGLVHWLPLERPLDYIPYFHCLLIKQLHLTELFCLF